MRGPAERTPAGPGFDPHDLRTDHTRPHDALSDHVVAARPLAPSTTRHGRPDRALSPAGDGAVLHLLPDPDRCSRRLVVHELEPDRLALPRDSQLRAVASRFGALAGSP